MCMASTTRSAETDQGGECVAGRLDYASTCVLELQLGLEQEQQFKPELDSLEKLAASLGHLLMMRSKDFGHFQGQPKMICVIVAGNHINWLQWPLAFAPNQ